MYNGYMLPLIDYCCIVWIGYRIRVQIESKLQKIADRIFLKPDQSIEKYIE